VAFGMPIVAYHQLLQPTSKMPGSLVPEEHQESNATGCIAPESLFEILLGLPLIPGTVPLRRHLSARRIQIGIQAGSRRSLPILLTLGPANHLGAFPSLDAYGASCYPVTLTQWKEMV
jgi:hypothetical protein